MLSALILSQLSYPAMLLAEQLAHQRLVRPDPLVQGSTPLKVLAPAVDKDQPVSRFIFSSVTRWIGLYHHPAFRSR